MSLVHSNQMSTFYVIVSFVFTLILIEVSPVTSFVSLFIVLITLQQENYDLSLAAFGTIPGFSLDEIFRKGHDCNLKSFHFWSQKESEDIFTERAIAYAMPLTIRKFIFIFLNKMTIYQRLYDIQNHKIRYGYFYIQFSRTYIKKGVFLSELYMQCTQIQNETYPKASHILRCIS